MNKLKDLLIMYLLIFIEFLILFNSKEIINTVINSSKIFIIKVFPTMFPTMIIGNLLVKQKIDRIIPKIIKKLFKNIFNFNDYQTGLFITSIFTGSPSNAIYINEYLENNVMTEKEAESMLCITHFINPLFIVGAIGVGVFNSIKIGFILFIMLITENMVKAFILRKKFNHSNITLNWKKTSFIDSLFSSIKTSINSCLMIFGIIVFFSILITLISIIFNISSISICIINGTLEMTSGIISLSSLNIPIIIKFFISYFFINFGGLCIQMQTISMIKNKKIRYLKYLIFRLI